MSGYFKGLKGAEVLLYATFDANAITGVTAMATGGQEEIQRERLLVRFAVMAMQQHCLQ
ncbi:MAG TPA: hypothetical protein VL995_22545 [Cellvibrio sp.]|nr:hypothetical protein [Cellvibrio sp.]